MTIADPDLRYDEETGNWCIGPIDWDEFWRVDPRPRPCNRERLRGPPELPMRGAWVREAAQAYARQSNTCKPPPTVSHA
ncbi:MAG: hypothetical protein KatS3mg043_1973 [Rhodothermaceae bacterium]|nr:MAG: hypothetical protein KatS3mg043_1973 [Rhodothermaceae bacterium]